MNKDNIYVIEENGKLHFHPDRGHNRFTEGRKKISDEDRWERLSSGLAGEFEKLGDAGTTSRPSTFNKSTDMNQGQMQNLDNLFFNGFNEIERKQVHTGFRNAKLTKSGPSTFPRAKEGEDMSTMWNYPPKVSADDEQETPWNREDSIEDLQDADQFAMTSINESSNFDPEGFRIEGIADASIARTLPDVVTVEEFARAGGILNLFKQASPNPIYTFGISDQQEVPEALHESSKPGMPGPLGHSKFKTFESLASFIARNQ